ncbi:uncharacterized protein LOC128712793 [Anopheles marshallii]|uniref:uncharacterized protein LOC128712793 n=1 Tax=Anopheles marshallii TaxID=1521116 RepID=UPI00237B00FC|nr:uncharacterized protein LOC128712793 [Anopheles marshallii]
MLATKELILWIVLGSFICTIATEEVEATTTLFEGQNLTTTSPTTPSTTFSSTTTSSSFPSSKATTNASAPTVPILARANVISSTSTIRSIISTTTAGATTKPSAKRQISLNEFQQLVAKVNDEISMLRNQSANLSQTYEELIRRYNERTAQIPIVLYDVTECSNSTTLQEASTTQAIYTESTVGSSTILSDVTNASVTTARATTATDTTVTTSTTIAPTSAKTAPEHSTQKITQPETSSDRTTNLETAPQNSGSSLTQIYGNKYYNYVHYFMYPPGETQLEEINNPPHVNNRRKGGNDSRNVAPVKQRKQVPYLKRNKWQADSREESEELELDVEQSSATFRRRPQASTGENRINLRPSSIESKLPFGGSLPAIGGPYRLGDSLPRKPFTSPSLVPPSKILQYPFVEERIPPRVLPREENVASLSENQKQVPPEAAPRAQVDKIAAFLERRSINRNGPTQRTTIPSARQMTSSTTVTRAPVTPPSLDSIFSFSMKPVNYSIPTTVKPRTGFVRNGWDGYDFSFVRKAQEAKKRLQREERSSPLDMRDL